MHAAYLAEELGIRRIVLPVHGAVFSALGMLMTDIRRDHIRTRICRLEAERFDEVAAVIGELETEARRALSADGIADRDQLLRRQAELRYRGQEHTVKVDLIETEAADLFVAETARRFHEAHQRAYRFRLDYPIEIVNFQVVAAGLVAKAELPRLPAGRGGAADARSGTRQVDFDQWGIAEAAIYDRARLSPGAEVEGPAVIQEPATTVPLPPGFRCRVDEFGNLHVTPPGRTDDGHA
jgi:N-methylhydantoinase A